MARILRLDQTRMYVIITYDITSTKLRNKIVKLCESHGFRSQKSIFEAYIKPAQYERLKQRFKWLIKLAKTKWKNLWPDDQIKFYILSKTSEDWWNRIDWLWPGYEKIEFEEVMII